MKTIISPFNMGPISKGQKLEIQEENSSWYYFDGISGIWDKALFEKYQEVKIVNNGCHNYHIPIDLYNTNKDFILDFNEYSQEACDHWDAEFGKFRIDGKTKIYTHE